MYNENKLRGKIAEARTTIAQLAAKIGINPTTLHRKITGETEFTRSEIQSVATELSLTPGDVQSIFFA
jgi:DNA-binding XRE family transcriptional regulator